MDNVKISVSVEYIWHMAAREAIAAEYPEIEPEHFFIALCKFAEMSHGDFERLGMAKVAIASIDADSEGLKKEIARHGIDAGAMRRKLRVLLGKGGAPYGGGKIHRSQMSRECFDKAAKAAIAGGSDTLMGRQILQVLLDSPTSVIAKLIAESGARAGKSGVEPGLVLLFKRGCDLKRSGPGPAPGTAADRDIEARVVIDVLTRERRNSVMLVTDDAEAAREVVVAAGRLMEARPPARPVMRRQMIDLSHIAADTSGQSSERQLLERLVEEAASASGFILYLPAISIRGQKLSSWTAVVKNHAAAGKVQFIARLPVEAKKRLEKEQGWRNLVEMITIADVGNNEMPTEL